MKRKLLPLVFMFIVINIQAADWTKVTLSVSPLKDFTFLKIDEKTCYAFALESLGANKFYPRIFKTTDGGNQWDTISQKGLILGAEVKEAFMAGTTMYVLGAEGLYKSTNNGADWTIAAKDYAGIYAPTDVSYDGTNIYISVYNGLYSTSDNFATLTNINHNVKLGDFNYQFMCAEKLNSTLIGGVNSKVYYLDGSNWTLCTGVPDRLSNFNMLAYENGNFYLSDRANNGYYLYHSTDGKAWTELEGAALSDITYTKDILWATKVASGTYRRTVVCIKNKTITDLNSDLPMLPITNGLVVLGEKLFVGLYGNTDAEAGLYVRSVSSYIGGSGPDAIKNPKAVKLNTWPNPASSVLHFTPDHNYSEYYITNIVGQKLHSGRLNQNNINITGIRNGIYQLTLVNKNGQKSSAIFIKQ